MEVMRKWLKPDIILKVIIAVSSVLLILSGIAPLFFLR